MSRKCTESPRRILPRKPGCLDSPPRIGRGTCDSLDDFCNTAGQCETYDSTAWEGDLRIADESTAGRLEIYHNGEWGTVCDDGFSDIDAVVACVQMGFVSGSMLTSGSTPDGDGTIWMDDLDCTGSEARLADCPFSGWGIDNCTHTEDVGVSCSEWE